MKKLILLFIAIVTFQLGHTQSALKQADRLFDTYYYLQAAETYKDYINNTKEDVKSETLLRAADANYLINNSTDARVFYQRVYQRDSLMDQPHITRFVRSLRSEGHYDEAHKLYTTYLERTGNFEELEKTKKRFEVFKTQLLVEEEPIFRLTNLSSNSKFSDFAPVIYGDSIIFSSSRTGNSKKLYSWNEQPYLSFFIVEKFNDSLTGKAKVFSRQSKSNYHDATIALAPDTTTVYFTSSNLKKNKLVLDKKRKNHFQLFKGNLVDGEIINREKLPFNSDFHSVSHPFVTKDGKYLFFASDMEGGLGGSDIYYCTINDLGVLSEPINAGKNINTTGNDFFPFLLGDIFYYSSNGPVGFGGLDIFKSTFSREDGTFSEIENLGKGANSNKDDFSIVFNDDAETGYVASNRDGGLGDDDIYFFTTKPLECNQLLTGNVIDKKSKEPLDNVLITVKNDGNEILTTVKTNATGDYELELPCNLEVTLIATKDDYFESIKIGTTGEKDGEKTIPVDFELEKAEDLIVIDEVTKQEKIDLDPIYFDFDKDNITPEAAAVLDNAVKLMKFYPDMVITIEAHTDSRGSDKYNFNLSDRRAKSTQEYIYSQGIAKNRILDARGYGERRLLNKCKNGVKCTDEQHDINRRSDFIILKR